jgi:hypothetical protein
LFVSLGYDEESDRAMPMRLLERADVTPAMAEFTVGRRVAREGKASAFRGQGHL